MSAPHERFEALAGAIALGEATPEERSRFEEHAADCAACRDDASAIFDVRARIETARDAEAWRPAIRSAVFAQIHERRTLQSRFAFAVLAWGFAAWILVSATLASGVVGHIRRALTDLPPRGDVVAARVAHGALGRRAGTSAMR